MSNEPMLDDVAMRLNRCGPYAPPTDAQKLAKAETRVQELEDELTCARLTIMDLHEKLARHTDLLCD